MSDWEEAVNHFAGLIKKEVDKDILKAVEEKAMEYKDQEFFCTKCQKVCTGIDCECTNAVDPEDIHVLPDGRKVVYEEEIILKGHPEIPTEEEIAEANQIVDYKGMKRGAQLIILATGRSGKSTLND